MDFLDPKKRRAHRIKLFIGYGLLAIALTFGSIILLYRALGYSRDPETGEIVQNGFVFVDSRPAAADVYLDGEAKGRTDVRLDIPAGEYDLELRAAGYRSWRRSFVLEGGKIERFVYPFLFPEELEISDVQLYASQPGLLTESPDRHWLLVQQPGGFQSFDLLDLTLDEATATTITLPDGLLTADGANHALRLVEWSSDNRHVLLKHTFEGGQEFLVLDIESPGASVNLSRTIPGTYTSVSLRDKRYDQYYLHTASDLRLHTADLTERTPVLYLDGVLAYKPHGSDVVAYVTAAGAPEGKAYLRVREGDGVYTLRELTAGGNYLIDIARFEDRWYVVGGAMSERRAYVFKNPVAAIKRNPDRLPVAVAALRTSATPEYVSFSANARFIAVQAGDEFSVYDAETDRQYRYDAELVLAPGQQATWMDGHRLTIVSEGHTVVFDYDGINKQTLSPALNGTPPLFDRDYEALFTLGPSVAVEGRPAITRTELQITE